MSTNFERILGRQSLPSRRTWRVYSVEQTRALETSWVPSAGSPTLMQTAGLALARLTLALVPHAQTIWLACGPGNNGGDGLEAAAHLQQWGKQVVVSMVHNPAQSPPDARQAWASATASGITLTDTVPPHFDACIDALFGIGTLRPLSSVYANWVRQMNASAVTTIAVDVPSGLQADTGAVSDIHVKADYTLSLLTLKPGLFTGGGRDACGEIWFNNLGVDATGESQALLLAPPCTEPRPHASHKGSFGDVCVVGGAPGMTGAALLAGRAALRGGAGRIFICGLGLHEQALDAQAPELMFRKISDMDWTGMTLVAGCGGGADIATYLPQILHEAKHLVLDADALNRVAENRALQEQVASRTAGSTVMTPHPLEAARLLDCSVAQIQANRLDAAQTLAARYQCVAVLKGSGTIIAAPRETARINPTGNAKLATAGTGDVLAGLVGARLAAGLSGFEAASEAVYRHGQAADQWPADVLNASSLCRLV